MEKLFSMVVANDLKDLYGLGARKIATFSTVPLGYLPSSAERPISRDDINDAAKLFNSKLTMEVKNLNGSLPQAKIVYVDVYNPLLDLIKNPGESGKKLLHHKISITIILTAI